MFRATMEGDRDYVIFLDFSKLMWIYVIDVQNKRNIHTLKEVASINVLSFTCFEFQNLIKHF